MNLLQHLFGFEHPETPGKIIFFRIFEVFVAGFTAQIAWKWGFYIRRISDVVLPLGIAQYVDISFLFAPYLSLLNAVLITICLVLGFFRVTRYAYLGGFLLLHFQYAARYSLGEIPHSTNMLGMTLLGLSLAMLFFQEDRLRRRFTLGFAYFFVGMGYTISSFCKLIGTGLYWADGRHLWMWVQEKGIDAFAKYGVLDFNMLQQLALDHYFVATAFLTIGMVTELSAVLLWWRPSRPFAATGLIGLHLGIYLVMNIMFTLSLIELILLGFPWAAWIDWSLERLPASEALKRLNLETS